MLCGSFNNFNKINSGGLRLLVKLIHNGGCVDVLIHWLFWCFDVWDMNLVQRILRVFLLLNSSAVWWIWCSAWSAISLDIFQKIMKCLMCFYYPFFFSNISWFVKKIYIFYFERTEWSFFLKDSVKFKLEGHYFNLFL